MTLNLKNKMLPDDDNLDKEVRDSANILNFCRTLNRSLLRYGNYDLLLLPTLPSREIKTRRELDYCEIFIKKNNALFHVCDWVELSCSERFYQFFNETMPKQKGLKVLPLINADDANASFNGHYPLVDWNDREFPMVSFSALSHFYGDKIQKVHTALGKGNLRLLDFTSDELIKYTNEEKRERRKVEPKIKPPEIGFSETGNGWHRSGFCLFYDEVKKICLLSGQDEGSYFILELPSKVNTIKQAMDVLIPKEARVPGTLRQGEWFFVPCKDPPLLHDTIVLFSTEGNSSDVYLPLDDVDSNRHWIETSDGRAGKDGRLYLFHPAVHHDEHATLEFNGGWCYVVKNTALRSYSESGVD